MFTSFSYKHPQEDTARTLSLRLNPYNVEFPYSLNTAVIDTYGGQVVQVLSVKIDSLVIEGQFGKEGPWGAKIVDPGFVDRRGQVYPAGGLAPKDIGEQWNNTAGQYGIGLTQMTDYFREYFAVSTQGADAEVTGHYIQVPMELSYEGRNEPWLIIPNSFPSYRRSNEDFAPMWRVQAMVWEAPEDLQRAVKVDAINRLNAAIGYRARNPYSDPLLSVGDAEKMNKRIVNNFKNLMPAFSQGQIEDMIWKDITVPYMVSGIPATLPSPSSDQNDYLDGEIGVRPDDRADRGSR